MGHPSGSAAEGLSGQFSAAPADIAGLYDDWVDDYDRDVESWGYQVPDLLADRLDGLGDDALVLDAGCGTGRAGVALQTAGFRQVIGVDYSRASLARARTLANGGVAPYAALVHLDLTKRLPIRDDAVDAVLSAGVFTYLPDVVSVVSELARVCRPGGRVVFSQRTDLWEARDTGDALASIRARFASLDWSDPEPYLPGHAEYGAEIKIRIVELVV